MTMQVIQHIELGSAAANITFSSIPQTYTDLYLVVSARTDSSTFGTDGVRFEFNDLTTNFSTRQLYGDGSGTGSAARTSNYVGALLNNSGSTSNTFSSLSCYLPNYTSSANKSFSIDSVTENNATGSEQDLVAGLWSNTAAITKWALKTLSGNYVAGSSATLYGITKGSDGTTTVS